MSAEPAPLLVVEDNPVYAEILQRLLPSLGAEMRFVPKCVDTAGKAIEEIANTKYSLVILDDKLPGADGMTVLAHIRSLPMPRQPAVIMLTGMGNESMAVEAMKRGAKDYLPKDSLDVPSLTRAISSALERKQLELQVARFAEELREKNAQVEADLNVAREVQGAFLPERYPTFPRNAPAKESALRFCHRYLPTGAVGGDFFDVLPISDTQAGVFICDVMGHGVRAALVTAMVRALAEELVSAAGEPDKFLVEINRGLLGILTQTRAPMFASAFYLVVDLARGELRYSSAGHPSALLVRRNMGTVEALRFPGSRPGPALGVFEESVYPICRCPVSPQDLVVLFTDGLYEVEGAEGDEYGQERLLAAVSKRSQLPAAQLFQSMPATAGLRTTSASWAWKSPVSAWPRTTSSAPEAFLRGERDVRLAWSLFSDCGRPRHHDGKRGVIEELRAKLQPQAFAECLCQGQSQPGMFRIGSSALFPPESFKEVCDIFGGEAVGCVHHAQEKPAVFHGTLGSDCPTARRVFHRVVHEIGEDGAQQDGIGLHFGAVGGVHGDNQFLGDGPFGKRLPDALDQGRKCDALRSDGELSALAPKQGKKAGDDTLHLQGDGQGFAVGGCLTGVGPLERDFGQTAQLGDGSAQFVSEISAELSLPFERLLQARQEIIQPLGNGDQLAGRAICGESRGQRLGVDARSAFGEFIQRSQLAAQEAWHNDDGDGQ